MVEQTCPTCGCVIGLGAHEKEGVFYCCAPCAAGEPCECGCCDAQGEQTEDQ